jgi:hypothetical protein
MVSMTWTSLSAPTWTPVRYINAVYSPKSNAVYIWGGSQIDYQKLGQMLTISSNGATTVQADLGVYRDSYSATCVLGSVLLYGGNYGPFFNTLFDYEVCYFLYSNDVLADNNSSRMHLRLCLCQI